MAFGREQYAGMNEKLTRVFRREQPAIMAHRGTSAGPVHENTTDAAFAAFRSGADIVEIDVIASADREFFVFHTGTEAANLGGDVVLETLTAQQIDQLQYLRLGRGGRVQRVERITELLTGFRGSEHMFNIDRSWHLWPDILDVLSELDMTDQLLLKAPATQPEAIAALVDHDTPFMFMLLCRSEEDLAVARDLPESLNLVGFELISHAETDAFHNPNLMRDIHEAGYFTLANAQVHGDSSDLFSGYDDEVSLRVDPDLGWGKLCDLRFDAIQTDWPALLRDYRGARLATNA